MYLFLWMELRSFVSFLVVVVLPLLAGCLGRLVLCGGPHLFRKEVRGQTATKERALSLFSDFSCPTLSNWFHRWIIVIYKRFILYWLFFFWYLLIYSQRSAIDTKGWDVFRVLPPEDTTGSLANQKVVELTVKIFKVVAYLLTFVIVLSAGVISKGTVLFMTSQLKPGKTTEYCTRRKSSSVSLWPFGFGHTSS